VRTRDDGPRATEQLREGWRKCPVCKKRFGPLDKHDWYGCYKRDMAEKRHDAGKNKQASDISPLEVLIGMDGIPDDVKAGIVKGAETAARARREGEDG
jgi:hypothetical protein